MDTVFEKVNIHPLNDHLWLLDEAGEATGYLLVGNERALLIDTMNGYSDLSKLVKTLTELPVTVVNTHGHIDHISGNVFFDEVYLNEKDWPLSKEHMKIDSYQDALKRSGKGEPKILPVNEGDIFELGGITVEVYEIPGHTQGGICFLDKQDRILLTGDSINGHTWMQLEESLPMDQFYENLERLKGIRDQYDVILTGHAKDFEDASLYEEQKAAVKELADRLAKGITEGDADYKWFGWPSLSYVYNEPKLIVYKKP